MSVAAEGPQVNCAKLLRSNNPHAQPPGSPNDRGWKPIQGEEEPISALARPHPWNGFSWWTVEGALVEVPQLHQQKASPSPSLGLFLGAHSLQKNCKGKFLTLKYFFNFCKYYIKQSRVQQLTSLLGMLVFSSPLLACNNSKLHKVRKWDQHKVQTNFHIKGLV